MDWSFSRRNAMVAAVVAVVALLPFIAKPYNIDDPLFVWSAKQILAHPGDPYGFAVNWFGSSQPMPEVMYNPPFACYAIAGAFAVSGGSEIAARILFLLISAATVLGIFYASQHFTKRPLIAALVALFTPAYMVCSAYVMPDVLMLGLSVWSVGLWMSAVDGGGRRLYVVSMLLFALALLTKYNSIIFLPIFPIALYSKTGRLGRNLLYLLIPACIFAAYAVWISGLYGWQFIPHSLSKGASGGFSGDIYGRILSVPAFAGGCMASAVFFAPYIMRRLGIAMFVFLAVAFASLLSILLGSSLVILAQIAFFSSVAAYLIYFEVRDIRRHQTRDSLTLAYWFFAAIGVNAFASWSVSGRYLLPLAPAAGILIARAVDYRYTCSACNLRKLALPVALSAALSMAVAASDYMLASTAKRAASDIMREYGAGGKVYFQGHWGFQYYMKELGGIEVDSDYSRIAAGSLVVVPENNTNNAMLPADVVDSAEILAYESFPNLLVMSSEYGVGFHSSSFGIVPYAFGRTPGEQYYIFRLKRPILGEKAR